MLTTTPLQAWLRISPENISRLITSEKWVGNYVSTHVPYILWIFSRPPWVPLSVNQKRLLESNYDRKPDWQTAGESSVISENALNPTPFRCCSGGLMTHSARKSMMPKVNLDPVGVHSYWLLMVFDWFNKRKPGKCLVMGTFGLNTNNSW